MAKKLYRSESNKMLGGVCGGIGEYFDIDPTIIRLLFVLISFSGGAGLLVYIVLWIVVPSEYSIDRSSDEVITENKEDIKKTVKKTVSGIKTEVKSDSKSDKESK